MDESTWLFLTCAALVMVSGYAIYLQVNLWIVTGNRGGIYRPGPYGPTKNSDESGSGCVMFLIMLLLIIYGVWLIYALFSG